MVKTVAKPSSTTNADATKDAVMRILHVDDDEDFLIISKRLLEKQDSFRVEGALSVKEALQKIGQQPYDVIISDYRMFGKSGLEFFKELRKEGKDVPFFLFTGELEEKMVNEAHDSGVVRCFSKNGNLEVVYVELASAIKEAVKSKRKRY
jgi:DNA-binding NtrC family response regulator